MIYRSAGINHLGTKFEKLKAKQAPGSQNSCKVDMICSDYYKIRLVVLSHFLYHDWTYPYVHVGTMNTNAGKIQNFDQVFRTYF